MAINSFQFPSGVPTKFDFPGHCGRWEMCIRKVGVVNENMLSFECGNSHKLSTPMDSDVGDLRSDWSRLADVPSGIVKKLLPTSKLKLWRQTPFF